MFDKNKNPPPETGAKSFCDICKREHVGGSKHCRFRDDKGGKPSSKVDNKNQDSQGGGGGKSHHSKQNKSFQGNKPNVNSKYLKMPDNPRGKRLRTSVDNNDNPFIDTYEQQLNTLSESDYACEYPMQASTYK